MNHEFDLSSPLEPERYELNAPPRYHFEVDRREFFKLLGAGVLIVCVLKDAQAQESGGDKRAQSVSLPKEIAAWLLVLQHCSKRIGEELLKLEGKEGPPARF